MSTQPAWSAAFTTDELASVERIAPIEQITREWAWGGSTGAGVKVAVIDSGIDSDHPAVGGRVEYVSVREAEGEMVFDQEPHGDDFGHGTECAGIIRSLAPDCSLYSVKVLGPQLRDEAYFQNIVLVAAANNLPKPSYPSLYSSLISVASHGLDSPEVYFWNPHPPVEFGARRIDVRVPWQNGGWITATGNSFAAPHIAGLVTRLLGKHRGLSVVHVKAIMRALADNVVDPAD